MWFVIRTKEALIWGAERYVWESILGSYVADIALFPDMLVGVGVIGLRCGGARGFAGSVYCSKGWVPSWRVREPSDHRRMRALDCNLFGLLGDRLHRIVLLATWEAENVDDGVVDE